MVGGGAGRPGTAQGQRHDRCDHRRRQVSRPTVDLDRGKPHRVLDGARWGQLGFVGGRARTRHVGGSYGAEAADDGRRPAGARIHRARHAARLLESDPDHQCVEPAARRQQRSRRRSRATGDRDVRPSVVAFRVRRWPASGVSRRQTGGLWIRDLDTDREFFLSRLEQPVRGFITADGSRVAFMDVDKKGAIFAVPSTGGVPENSAWTVATACLGRTGRETRRDCSTIAGSPSEVFVLDLRSGEKRRVLQRPPNHLWQAQILPGRPLD